MSITRMSVGGVQHLIERAYRESGQLQYLRELYVNAIEAGATRVEFGPEWQAVERDGVYRLMVADNGCGMNAEQLLQFLNTFGGGGKPIGDAHENYGVGSKTSLLPWNHNGVVVISWTADAPEGAMVWLMRDAETGEYGAKKFVTANGDVVEVVVPFAEWSVVRPDWILDHGTVVICLGNQATEHTFLGKGGEGDIKGIAAYLNKRIWEVPEGVEVYVQELRLEKSSEWPRSLAEAQGKGDRRWNRRKVRGARHFVEYEKRNADDDETTSGELADAGVELLSDGTAIHWYLWSGERPKVHSYAQKSGFIAALYRNELYDTQTHVSNFRTFGITHSSVRGNLTLIAVPPKTDGTTGVYPDTARNALKIQGSKRAGEPLPWSDWGQEFAQRLPTAIRKALASAGSASTGTLQDQSWRTRLVDRFGARWKALRWFLDPKGTANADADQPGGTRGGPGSGAGTAGTSGGGGAGNGPGATGAPQGAFTWAQQPRAAGGGPARAETAKGGLPEYEWTVRSELDESESYGAAWCPPSKDRPFGLVQIARDFPSIVEVKKHWQEQYPDHLGDRIAQIVEDVYAQAMVARVAHSEQFASDKGWGRTRVESELRSLSALTMALLGLLSEDHVIASRISGLGARRSPLAARSSAAV